MRRCLAPVVSINEVYAEADILVERNRTVCPSFVKARILIKYSKFDGPNKPTTVSGSEEDDRCGMRVIYFCATRDANKSNRAYV
jgi:hypothetical protein